MLDVLEGERVTNAVFVPTMLQMLATVPGAAQRDYSALRSIAWEGRFLVIGFAAGDIPKMPLNLALLKGCDIRGVFWGAWARINPEKNRANLEKLVKWTAEGKISSHVDRTFPLAQTADALKVLAGRKAMGKVILHP